jgi:uncharacterized protein (UPF0335 family)|tara:strand:- start:460 stop:693 length:234 start_codon:yes stop_codon:yes gene_type:complete
MAVKETVEEFVSKFMRIENEKSILADDQKELFAEYKDQMDLKALRAAIQIAKIKIRLGQSEGELDNMLETVENKFGL